MCFNHSKGTSRGRLRVTRTRTHSHSLSLSPSHSHLSGTKSKMGRLKPVPLSLADGSTRGEKNGQGHAWTANLFNWLEVFSLRGTGGGFQITVGFFGLPRNLSLSLSHTHRHSYRLSHSLLQCPCQISLSVTLSLAQPQSHSRTHTHTHTLEICRRRSILVGF